MKTSLFLTSWLFLAGALTFAGEVRADEAGIVPTSGARPFKRAMVLSGDNLNTGKFLGMIDAAAYVGKPADVIVGSCGGSIAAALANAIPDSRERLRFLRSKAYYDLLRGLPLADISLADFIGRVLDLWKQERSHLQVDGCQSGDSSVGKSYKVPSVFDFALIHADKEFEVPALTKPFSPDGIRAVIVASRAEFEPGEVGMEKQKGEKLFTEVYFTDPQTGKYLRDLPSFVGQNFPGSAIRKYTETITGATLAQAVRASTSDPGLLFPAKIEDRRFLTGAVNIDPVTVAQHLATEVMAQYKEKYDTIVSTPTLESTFYFPANKARKLAMSQKVDYWIDSTKDSDIPSLAPGPKLSVTGVEFASSVPDSYTEYLKVIDSQYNMGWTRTTEALRAPRYSKSHIREPIGSGD